MWQLHSSLMFSFICGLDLFGIKFIVFLMSSFYLEAGQADPPLFMISCPLIWPTLSQTLPTQWKTVVSESIDCLFIICSYHDFVYPTYTVVCMIRQKESTLSPCNSLYRQHAFVLLNSVFSVNISQHKAFVSSDQPIKQAGCLCLHVLIDHDLWIRIFNRIGPVIFKVYTVIYTVYMMTLLKLYHWRPSVAPNCVW